MAAAKLLFAIVAVWASTSRLLVAQTAAPASVVPPTPEPLRQTHTSQDDPDFVGPRLPRLTPIEQATSRTGADFTPALEGRTIRVHGQVTEKAFWNVDGFVLPIRDQDEDFGILILGAPGVDVRGYAPGLVIEATGQIVRYRGMPVLVAASILQTGVSETTGSRQVALPDSAGFRNLALPVEIEGRIVSSSDDGALEMITITDGHATVRVVLPKLRRDDEPRLHRFRPGDRIRASGVVTQNALLPPYDRFFQITMVTPERIALLETAAMIPSYMLLSACICIGTLGSIWWVREQRKQGLRRIIEPMHTAGEEILAAASLAEIVKKVQAVVPRASGVSGVSIYLYDRKERTLERAGQLSPGATPPVSLDQPANPLHASIGACFRTKSAVNVPDTRRSYSDERRNLGFRSDPGGAHLAGLPRSILALPMLAQDEISGVMLFYRNEGVRYFHHDEQASAQHLANQVAAAMKLLEQRAVREQLFKSDKLAATGQLIAGVVNDLRSPVEAMLTMSQLLLFRGRVEQNELEVLATEAQRTAEIVSRLISFGRKEDAVAKPVELNAALAGLLQFREREWKSAGIRLQDRTCRDGVYVIGAQGQLEQVLLNILLYAERAAGESANPVITVGTALLGRRILVDIDFPALDGMPDPFGSDADSDSSTGGGLALLRSIIQSHGGDIRFESLGDGSFSRLEVELPRAQIQQQQHAGDGDSGESMAAAAAAAVASAAAAGLRLTAIIVEPDLVAQRTFVSWMSRHGHRVIPVRSAEEAIDLVQRVKCDVLACTSLMQGFHWHVLYERVRGHSDAFVLLLDECEIGHAFEPGAGYVLRKPLHEADFDRVLAAICADLAPPLAQTG